MKKIRSIVSALILLSFFCSCSGSDIPDLTSPDGKISLRVFLEEDRLNYEITLDGNTVLERSPLGIVTEKANLSEELHFTGTSNPKEITESYNLPFGKKSKVDYTYKEQTYSVKNKSGDQLDITFRVSDDGVAYSYRIYGTGSDTVRYETSGFKFPETATAFMTPLSKAKTGWEQTNPSYEDQYQRNIPVGTPSDYEQGWVYPALFKIENNGWVLISETGTDQNYVGTHLADNSDKGLYKVEFPHADHNLPTDPATASVQLPFSTPWRTITIGKTLQPIVASTMAQDLVKPKYAAKSDYKPGKATWSWLTLKDRKTDYETSKEFIDMAGRLNFEYCLIDGWWDKQIGKEKIEELAKYAQTKNVRLLLWYNSNGQWNTAPQTPKDKMTERDIRREEMAWMQKIGIKGIKVDFFGGDKQRVMKLYEDILTDANDFGIVVNFHGCTLPRGWDRMFPNFVTDEAVMGMEFCTFDQKNEDKRPAHATTLPFTRNVTAPMDFTPVILNSRLGERPGEGPTRVTTAGFELALPVIFYSPVEHFGLIPENLDQFPEFVWDYFRQVPSVWDETVLIDGTPGNDVIIARKKADDRYVAGINGENKEKTFEILLPMVKNSVKATLITDKKGARNEVELREITIEPEKPLTISVEKYGGFVLQFQ